MNDLNKLFTQRVYPQDEPLARRSIQHPIQIGEYGAPQPVVVLYDPEMPRERHPHPEDLSVAGLPEMGAVSVEEIFSD